VTEPPIHARDAANAPQEQPAEGEAPPVEVRDDGMIAALAVLSIGQGQRMEFAPTIAKLIRETGGGPIDLVLIAVPPGTGRPVAEDLATTFAGSEGEVEDKRGKPDEPPRPEIVLP
jgi:Mrp family chromosome partitioning ATPase